MQQVFELIEGFQILGCDEDLAVVARDANFLLVGRVAGRRMESVFRRRFFLFIGDPPFQVIKRRFEFTGKACVFGRIVGIELPGPTLSPLRRN